MFTLHLIRVTGHQVSHQFNDRTVCFIIMMPSMEVFTNNEMIKYKHAAHFERHLIL